MNNLEAMAWLHYIENHTIVRHIIRRLKCSLLFFFFFFLLLLLFFFFQFFYPDTFCSKNNQNRGLIFGQKKSFLTEERDKV